LDFKRDFNEIADDTQDSIDEVIESSFDSIRDTLNIVRSENIALESEKDPGFRNRVEARVKATKDEMERLYAVIAT
jgi:hypothetical protein